MQKRGQITVFLVIGIVLLLLALAFYFIFTNIQKAPLELEAEEVKSSLGVKGALQSYVQSCIEETVDPSLYLLAQQGGIIYLGEEDRILLTEFGVVNYAWLNGLEGISKEKMEQDLGKYLEEYVDFCLGGFAIFTRQGIMVEADFDNVDSKIIIQDFSIDANLNLPVSVTLPNKDNLEVGSFSTKIQSNLGKMVKDAQALNLPDVTPSELAGLPYTPIVFPFDESVTIYTITEQGLDIPLSFAFAVRNDFPANQPPILEDIADRVFRVGNKWEESLFADDENNDLLIYSSDSSQFPVTPDGEINLELTSVGDFQVIFTVVDGRGGEDSQEVEIVVLEK